MWNCVVRAVPTTGAGHATVPTDAKLAELRLRHQPLQTGTQPLQPISLQGQPYRRSRRVARSLRGINDSVTVLADTSSNPSDSTSRLATGPRISSRAGSGSPQRHAEQHLHRQAGLDGGIAVGLLSATPARRRGIPAHPWIEPDRQRAAALERFVIGRPVPGLVGGGGAVCPCIPAITLDSRDESLTGFVQQSPLPVETYWRESFQKAALSLSPNIATVSFVGFSAGFLIA